MKLAPPTPLEAWHKLGKMRDLFAHMRDERMLHPSVSIETRETVATYYGDMIESLDVARNALMKAHGLKIEPNLLETALHG